MDTIYALSSGRPPAAIAVVRISGPQAMPAGAALAGKLPSPRRAALRTLRDGDGVELDRALVLVFPGPETATGEDLVELHLHGGRAIVAAVERALAAMPGLRPAMPGEFTRRSLHHGRIDLAQAEGLADLLEAETETQRRVALSAAEGAIGRLVDGWLERASAVAARVEAELDFSDEDEVSSAQPFDIAAALAPLVADIEHVLRQPTVERLDGGVTIVLAGPPNAGKSSLFNALLNREAAIVTPIAGTTRDVLEANVMRAGIPYRLVDTAGLAVTTDDAVERIGIARAQVAAAAADIVLWLGPATGRPAGAIWVGAKSDLTPARGDIAVSIHRPATIAALWAAIEATASPLMSITGDTALRDAQVRHLHEALEEFRQAGMATDMLLSAEHLRIASHRLGAIAGRDATEAMLDALFGRFCLGK